MSRRRSRVDAGDLTAFAERLVSCPECGVLCVQWDGPRERPRDIPLSFLASRVVPVLGIRPLMAQWVGYGNGRVHACPPCRDVVPAELVELVEGGAR